MTARTTPPYTPPTWSAATPFERTMTANQLTVCYAVKGGSGTTVTVAAMGLADPSTVLLVDLAGELPAVLGMPEPHGDGIAEWFSSSLPADALELLTIDVNSTTRLLPRGHHHIDPNSDRWDDLAAWLTTRPCHTIADAGTGEPPHPLLEHASRALLVTRPCYLALRRAVSVSHRPTGVVLVNEPGRALRAPDVARAIGVPVVAQLALDPSVARAVDAGLLAARLPAKLQRQLRSTPTETPPTPDTAPPSHPADREPTLGRLCSISSIQTVDPGGPRPVTVEVHVADGVTGYQIVGYGDRICRTSRDRLRAAFLNSNLAWPDQQITVNIAPSGPAGPDPAVDVAIAVGILAATGRLDPATATSHAYVGQLGPDGSVAEMSRTDRSTIAELTGLPPATLGHLRDLAPAANQPSTPAEQIVARWRHPPSGGVGVDQPPHLGGIA